jgi:hypothetical protein
VTITYTFLLILAQSASGWGGRAYKEVRIEHLASEIECQKIIQSIRASDLIIDPNTGKRWEYPKRSDVESMTCVAVIERDKK